MKTGRRLVLVALLATLAFASPWAGNPAGAAGALDGAAAAAQCTTRVTVQQKSIIALCGGSYGSGVVREDYDGRIHYFVVRASDRAVSHIWQLCRNCTSFSNWTSLGGTALSEVSALSYTSPNGAAALGIWVIGTDNGVWCKDYNYNGSGSWSGWWSCGP
jgi:hypothetical protein